MTSTGPEPAPSTALAEPPRHPRRIVYLGTPEMAVAPLRALVEAGYEVVLVITGKDKRRGRRGAATPTPVKATAEEMGLPIGHDPSLATSVGADLGVVVAFGQILRRPVLEALPMVNIHFSLLPRWRGAAPVERAILAGDTVTGVCVMAVEEGLDTGGVYARTEVPLGPDVTAADLRSELTAAGSNLLVDTLNRGLGTPEPQVGEVTYAAKIHTRDLRLDWNRPAMDLHRLIRVGGAWSTWADSRLKVHKAIVHSNRVGLGLPGALHGVEVTTGDGTLELTEVQPEGKGPMSVKAWLNGIRPSPGEVLGSEVDR